MIAVTESIDEHWMSDTDTIWRAAHDVLFEYKALRVLKITGPVHSGLGQSDYDYHSMIVELSQNLRSVKWTAAS